MRSHIAPAPSRNSSPPAWPDRVEPGFGVYVHWPFCASKCPYCDFNSHVRAGGFDEAGYLAACLRELSHVAQLVPGRTVGSVFFGGGTPSLMQPATVAAILDAVAGHWTMAPDAEITLEANPSSVEADRFRGYRAAGVNRASLGVQSLDEAQLAALGRLHTVTEAKAAIRIAQQTFERSSFDIIYARPRQTLDAWRRELGEALSLAGRHLSLYQLTIEAGTPYADLHARGRLIVPDAMLAGDFYDLTQNLTDAAGLPAYEISNHAAPGEESRHNLLYWRYGEYAGIGPGAHGRLVFAGNRHALATERHPERWMARVHEHGHGFTEDTPLTTVEACDEALLMGLRIAEGLDLGRLCDIGGLGPDQARIARLVELEMIEVRADGNRLVPTRQGRLVLNEIAAQLAAALRPVG